MKITRTLVGGVVMAWATTLLPGPALAADPAPEPAWDPLRIIGSKHDLTQLNARAGVEAMAGVAYSDYQDPCVYCHIPPENESDPSNPGQLPGWNRIRPVDSDYRLYDSATMDGTVERPNDISLLCLSCHDGTMAVDRIAHRPATWSSSEEATLHMRLNASDDLESCGKCHDGSVAHNIQAAALGTNLGDDHPISMRYAGLDFNYQGFRPAESPRGFANGVRLYDGNVECASCHDVHNPDVPMLLRTNSETLCTTCHAN